ncbi:LruC domain-containing protein [Lunatibacter salilacus]|uniref:LruC domain-containing protein n=1 Tax=Lunatibacter salilacus TaxID=2483804 RepID=UPI00131C4F0A|nr:LruC domain-containing protein [Lunatibacter salilacus]
MKNNSLLFVLGILLLISSCDIRDSIEETPIGELKEGYLGINLPNGFNFATTKKVTLNLSAVGRDKSPIPFVTYRIYDKNPLEGGQLMQTLRLDESGSANTNLDIPSFLTEIWVTSPYIGVEPVAVLPISGTYASYKYDASKPSILPESYFKVEETDPNARVAGSSVDIAQLGTWDSQGRPNYLVQPDNISAQLLKNINISLPERSDIRTHNPDILNEKYARELFLNEDGEVWITYVHTGAGYRNAIGYYWYKEGEQPLTPADIKNKTIIFPNIQAGVLTSGDKVKLEGPLNGAFEKNTYIGWFLIADGWKGKTLTSGKWTLYADSKLNSFIKRQELRDHMVFLYDATEKILLMGWEDIKRDESGSDHDFNDAVFFASWNPITSVDLSEYAKIDTNQKDRDGDGVADELDEYPDDSDRAFTNYSPGQYAFGSLMFEDLWPSFGDYDMNDLVVDYQVKEISDAHNRIKEVSFTVVIRATGAGFKNGFGIQLPVASGLVESVKGNRLTTGSIKTKETGVEDGQRLTTVIITDDVNYKLPIMANVSKNNAHNQEDTLHVSITFKDAIRKADLGAAPYNPFLVINQDRRREVHLKHGQPSDLVDVSLFGANDDYSNPTERRFYSSKKGFNWALHTPVSIPHTQERIDFTKAYTRFADWARSGGREYVDWYLDIKDHRNSSVLYIK